MHVAAEASRCMIHSHAPTSFVGVSFCAQGHPYPVQFYWHDLLASGILTNLHSLHSLQVCYDRAYKERFLIIEA